LKSSTAFDSGIPCAAASTSISEVAIRETAERELLTALTACPAPREPAQTMFEAKAARTGPYAFANEVSRVRGKVVSIIRWPRERW